MTDQEIGNELTFSDLMSRGHLRRYLENVRAWHGYIRFLGLPDRRDNPDIIIDRLFVEPLVANWHVLPDEDPSDWMLLFQSIFDVLDVGRPIVLLGDPGSGKSTLLNYLVWTLSRPSEPTVVDRFTKWLLPVPITLRELSLSDLGGWDQLMQAFLHHPMTHPLEDTNYIDDMARCGRVLFLIDGIDEVGSLSVRRALREAVHEGFLRYGQCRWILTSRIVGYSDVPFHLQEHVPLHAAPENDEGASVRPETGDERGPQVSKKVQALVDPSVGDLVELGQIDLFDKDSIKDDTLASVRYIVPFDDQRIATFARHWYVQREAAVARAGESAEHLVRALHEDPSILRLARIPNLLTMMALIHRIETTLPHGRALLYERISEAYLESIDKFRGVYSGAYDFQQKRSWLARVGFELQRRRTADKEKGARDTQLLVSKQDVVTWIEDDMSLDSGGGGGISAGEFLDIVGRRSGLFLPRGEDRYAFVHLSFQEYFAAVALEHQVTSLSWAKMQETRLGVNRMVVQSWAKQGEWFETFGFVFELLAPKTDWHRELVAAVFGEEPARTGGKAKRRRTTLEEASNLTRLLLRLVGNPRSGLPESDRINRLRQATKLSAKAWNSGISTREGSEFAEVLHGDSSSDNAKLSVIVDELDKCGGFALNLSGTKVRNISPLENAKFLKHLRIGRTRIDDLEPLRGLRRLEVLRLDGTSVDNLEAVVHMLNMRFLSASRTMVKDLEPLSNLRKLRGLFLNGTEVTNLDALAELTVLEIIGVAETKVHDLTPLSSMTNLKNLDVSGSNIVELEWVRPLRSLEGLELRGTRVKELEALAQLSQLRRLVLWDTQTKDLGPLAGLIELRSLDLDGTKVEDFRPLAGLKNLRTLYCQNIIGKEVLEEDLREMLPDCEIYV